MKAAVIGEIGNGDLIELRETFFEKELDLEEFLPKHAALRAGDQTTQRTTSRALVRGLLLVNDRFRDYLDLPEHASIDDFIVKP